MWSAISQLLQEQGHGVRSSVVGGVNHSEQVQRSPNILQLEAVLAEFGDLKGAEVTMLQESLRSARRAPQVPLLGV